MPIDDDDDDDDAYITFIIIVRSRYAIYASSGQRNGSEFCD